MEGHSSLHHGSAELDKSFLLGGSHYKPRSRNMNRVIPRSKPVKKKPLTGLRLRNTGKAGPVAPRSKIMALSGSRVLLDDDAVRQAKKEIRQAPAPPVTLQKSAVQDHDLGSVVNNNPVGGVVADGFEPRALPKMASNAETGAALVGAAGTFLYGSYQGWGLVPSLAAGVVGGLGAHEAVVQSK